jgi:integrase
MAKFEGVRPKAGGIEIRYTDSAGKRRSVFIKKTPTDANQADAARYRRRLIEADAIGDTEADQLSKTFEHCCRGFLADKGKSLKPSTLVGYRSKLECYWSDLGPLYIRTIKLPDLKAIDRAIEWQSQKTRRDAHAVLRGVFDWAVHEELASDNPATKLEAGAWAKPEIDAFTDDERQAILAELPAGSRAFYGLMFETGARTGELLALRWRDVTETTIRIAGSTFRGEIGTTKTHQERSVMLTKEAQRILRGHTATRFQGEFVFINQYGDAYAGERGLTVAFRAACKRAGVRYRRPYNCRHTFATTAIMAGANPAWVAKQMGDRLETVMRHYAVWISGKGDAAELEKLNSRGISGERTHEKRKIPGK